MAMPRMRHVGLNVMVLTYSTLMVIATAVTLASTEYTHLRQLSVPASESIPSLSF